VPLAGTAWALVDTTLLPILIAATAALTIAALSSFVCPRCGKPFERRRTYSNPWTQCCLNCGIARGTPKG
jgi:hypothetical protein